MKKVTASLLLTVLLLILGCTIPARAQTPTTLGFFADINGARIFYTITGQGEPLVLIHGYPLNGDLFARQRDELGRSFRVITLDLRGFGRSVAPNEQASIDIYSSDVLALLDLLGIQRALIGGHSMGGITTLNIYRRAPERFSAMLLISTVAAPASIIEQFMWRGYAQQSREQGAESLLPIALPEFLTGRTRRLRPDLVNEGTRIIRQASLNGLVGGATALAERPDLRGVLPLITVPTFILVGEEDSLTPVEVSRMIQAGIANSELVIIEAASHGAIGEQPERANAAILNWATRTANLRR